MKQSNRKYKNLRNPVDSAYRIDRYVITSGYDDGMPHFSYSTRTILQL